MTKQQQSPAYTLLSVTEHCLRSRDYANVIIAGKQSPPQWLDVDAAIKLCTAGIGKRCCPK